MHDIEAVGLIHRCTGDLGMSYTFGKLRKRVDCLTHLFAYQKKYVWIKVKEKNLKDAGFLCLPRIILEVSLLTVS